MIVKNQNIRTEKPIVDVWNYLSMYKDESFVEKLLIKNHNIEDSQKNKKNIQKQVKQIKYSIIQAKEYFDSSNYATIATKPLLLYYGSVALSRALILLTKDGSYSYDALRKTKKHNHHGLDLKKEFLNKQESLSDFLKSLSCYIYYKGDEAWGNFPLFYDSLLPDVSLLEGSITQENSGLRGTISLIINNVDKKEIGQIKEESLNVFSMLTYLPDLALYLKEIGIASNLFPGNMSLNSQRKMGIRANGKIIQQDTVHTYNFIINEINDSDQIEWFNTYYKEHNHEFISIADSVIMSKITEIEKLGEKPESIYFPESVSSISEELFYIYQPENYIQESASYFITAFIFGMLCRYYPDIWMEKIQNLYGFSEFIAYYMEIYSRKFPNLILNQMGRKKYIFK